MSRRLAALLASALAATTAGESRAQETAAAQEPDPDAATQPDPASYPLVVAIEFEGNHVTQPRTMLREMQLKPGDAARPERIASDRQAIQDLGLFRTVEVAQEPVEGGVRLRYTVREKFYIVPLPRLDAKDSGEYAYGLQLRWFNVRGLNESLRVVWEERDRKERNVGRENSFSASYNMPQIADSRYSVDLSAGYTQRPVESEDAEPVEYEERLSSTQVLVRRSLSQGTASQGWSIGGGVLWRDQQARGGDPSLEYGMATAPVLLLGYRDLHYNRFSENGRTFSLRAETATDGWASDYHYVFYSLDWREFHPVGGAVHQSFNTFAELNMLHGGGNPDNARFNIGGSSNLRGYDSDFREGDAAYRVGVEYLRPVGWEWLRGLVILEAGNAFVRPEDFSFGRVYTSLGVGARLRLDWFVDIELELGYAIPLDGSTGGRVFVGRP